MENEQVEQEKIKMEETRKQLSKLEGPRGAPLGEVIGAVITVGVLGFWFGVGAALGYCLDAKMLTIWKNL